MSAEAGGKQENIEPIYLSVLGGINLHKGSAGI